ncbi:MAG: DUF4383 domain-containing protein [Thermoleophilia bacterium]
MAANELSNRDARGWPGYTALLIGIVYALIGIAGFFLTGFSGFFARSGEELLGIFEVNGLHNVVHLAAGIVLILGFYVSRLAVAFLGAVFALVFLGLAIVGPFLTGSESNILALNAADHWLHLGTGVVLGAVSYSAYRARSERTHEIRDACPGGVC